MEDTETFKPLTIHEYHSYVTRCFEHGLIDERKYKFRLENVNTFTNTRGEIYVHVDDLNQLRNAEDRNKST